MEAHILQLLATDEESSQTKYRNNVQYPKKQYPLAKTKVKKGTVDSQRGLTKIEREPLIDDLVAVIRLVL